MNTLEQLAALMRTPVTHVLGQDPTDCAPIDYDSLSEEQQKRLQEIALVTHHTVEQLLRSDGDQPATPLPTPPTVRAAIKRFSTVVHSELAEMEKRLVYGSPQPSPPNDGDPTSPTDPTPPPPTPPTDPAPTDPTPPTHPTPADPTPPTHPNPTHPEEPDVPIIRPDFAHAHARIAIDGDRITVEKSTGIKKETVRFATDAPEGNCNADSARRTSMGLIYVNGSDTRPRNARLVRMDLSADHKIDPSEVVVLVSAADRETAYRHDFDGFSVSDDSVDVAIRDSAPDVSRPKIQARFDVVMLRIG